MDITKVMVGVKKVNWLDMDPFRIGAPKARRRTGPSIVKGTFMDMIRALKVYNEIG